MIYVIRLKADKMEITKQFEYVLHLFTLAYAYTYTLEYHCVIPVGTVSFLWNWVWQPLYDIVRMSQ